MDGVCTEILDQHHVTRLPWSAISPNQPTTEHHWNKLVINVRYHVNSDTVPHCTSPFETTLNNIFVKKLIGSMRQKCEAVVATAGSAEY